MSKTIILKAPITTHDGETKQIVLRDPIGADYIAINKMPFSVIGTGDDRMIVPDYKVAVQWLTRLSGIDEILIGKLNRDDFLAAINGVADHMSREGDNPGNSPA